LSFYAYHRVLLSFPTRRSSDLEQCRARCQYCTVFNGLLKMTWIASTVSLAYQGLGDIGIPIQEKGRQADKLQQNMIRGQCPIAKFGPFVSKPCETCDQG